MRKVPTTLPTTTTQRQIDDDCAYLALLVERADAGRMDPIRHSSEDVEAEMETILADHVASLRGP